VRVLYCLDRSTMTNASLMLPISRPTTLAIPDALMSVVMLAVPGAPHVDRKRDRSRDHHHEQEERATSRQ
jgi:hypothetical protein